MKGQHARPGRKMFCRRGRTQTRKRWELIIIFLVLIKLGLLTSLLLRADSNAISQLSPHEAAAQEDAKINQQATDQTGPSAEDPALKTAKESSLFEWDLDLLNALRERESNVRLREQELRKEEERLMSLKQEIEKRIETLARVETKVAELIKTKQVMEEENINQLAKVFESTPPEQAGPMLTKLDVQIAAQIITRMSGRKAGKIWGYVDPDRAVKISKKVASMQTKSQ